MYDKLPQAARVSYVTLNSFSAGTDYRRHILTSKVDSRTDRFQRGDRLQTSDYDVFRRQNMTSKDAPRTERFQRGDRLQTSDSDVYRRQNLTSIDAPRTERAILPMHYMMAEVYVSPNPFSAGTEF